MTSLKNTVLGEIDKILSTKKIKNESYIVQPKKITLSTEKLSAKVKNARIKKFEETVESLNRINIEVDSANREDANSINSNYRNLKLSESFAINESFLQGHFLDNISDLNSVINMDMLCYMRLARDFGDFETWQKDFIACVKSSRGGYVVTAYSIYLKRYLNLCIDDATTGVPFSSIPVIVLDVSQGCYARDYVDDVQLYASNMMREFKWQTIDERFKKCEKVAKVFE